MSFAISSRGADHLRGYIYVNEIFQGKLIPYCLSEEKINILIEKENMLALVDSLVMCRFGRRNGEFTLEVLSDILTQLTGTAFSAGELYLVGERVYNLERMYYTYRSGGWQQNIPRGI